MSNQGTIRLKVTNGAPAIEKLWNGRFKLEFLCDNNSPKEDWYYDNISSILPDYGILQETNFGSGVSEDWEAIPGSVYPDMRLVETEYVYIPSMGDKRVKLTYETLTASWVEEKDEDTDYELNGLKRVSRTFVALPDTAYDKVVGTSTIDSNGTTLYLGSFKIEETDAKWSLSEVWLEAGELSREENSEDAKGSISITQIGGCPAAPAGYTVVNESKNNTRGFETCSRTFYRNDSELSRSNDYVGSQLAESIEVFGPTAAPAPTNNTAVLGNKSTSNVDGIPTIRYTFLVPSILSESSDKVGSQLAITIEAFGEVPATPTGYAIANERVSDFEGIPTTRYTFLRTNVELSRSEDKVGSQLAIVVEQFDGIPATPAGYSVANTQESDVEGIPTKRYTFLKPSVLSRTDIDDGSRMAIIIEAFEAVPAAIFGYALTNTQVSDVEGIPTNRYTFLKEGLLSESSQTLSDGLTKKSYTWLGAAVGQSGVLTKETIGNYQGLQTVTQEYMILPSGFGSNFDYKSTVPFTIPGTVTTAKKDIGGGKNLILITTPPVQTTCVATIDVSYSTDSTPTTTGLYQPSEWSSAIVSGVGYNYRPISYTNTMSNYIRIGSGDTIIRTQDEGPAIPPQALMGQFLYINVLGRIELTGPTDDPAGTDQLLSVSVDPVFSSTTGTQYYKTTKVTAKVPSRG